MADHRAVLAALEHAAGTGTLARLCERFGIDLLVAFGSSVDSDPDVVPEDLDLAFSASADVDLLGFLDALADLSGPAEIDLVDLRRGTPVLRAEALLGGEPLYERVDGAFATAQMRAFKEREDTAWMRRIELELLAE